MLERAKHVIVGVCVRGLRSLKGGMFFVMGLAGSCFLLIPYRTDFELFIESTGTVTVVEDIVC
jgi:hypothetical protein